MNHIARFSTIALRIVGGMLAYVFAQILGNALLPLSPGMAAVPAEDAAWVLPALGLVALAFTLIIAFFARRSSWSSRALIPALAGVFYVVNTLLLQVETWYFRSAFPLVSDADLVALFGRGLVSALVFVPAVVLLFRAAWPTRVQERDWTWQPKPLFWLLAALVYVPLYLGFGMLAQLAPVLRAEYAEWIREETLIAFLPVLQVGRGLVIAGAAALVISFFPRRRDAGLAAILVFSGFMSLELFYPSPIMSGGLRLVHGIEIASSMLCYALASRALLTRPRAN